MEGKAMLYSEVMVDKSNGRCARVKQYVNVDLIVLSYLCSEYKGSIRGVCSSFDSL